MEISNYGNSILKGPFEIFIWSPNRHIERYFELIKDQSISMSLKKTLKLTESALAVEFTNDKKYIAVSLLDSTVKIFYRDTLKFWNSLYGHQLPVNCLAASQDSTLMVTGSGLTGLVFDANVTLF